MSAQEVRARRDERLRDGASCGQSFSSSLLDEIYRSIDDGVDKRSGELKFYRHNLLKKQGNSINDGGDKRIGELKFYRQNVLKKQGKSVDVEEDDDEIANVHRALLIERWIEKKVAQRRRSEPEMKFHDHREEEALFFSSTSSSSDSSFGFSSSDTESSIHGSKSSLKPSCFAKFRPKPVRVSAPMPEKKQSHHQFICNKESGDFDEESSSSIIKSKSRALKIYSNLKKMKQPISPGGRLSSFLNSIFTAGTPKKSQSHSSVDPKSKSGQTSTCSSAASFSRSCLSKNSPSSSEKLRNAERRTVRFHPISTIVDEYCKPCGHRSLQDQSQPPLLHVKNNHQTAATRKILTDCHQIKNKNKNDLILITDLYEEQVDDDDDDDDAASCSSSDLFELDHVTNRYREELPVYESTTRVDSNRAIRHR